MNKYKTSVIVPVYNAEKHLHKCINSLLNQSLNEIEIILVNDGSQDTSGQICDYYAKSNDNITVVHIDNSGPAKARNTGIKIAKGEYLAFCDSDDYVQLDMYEKLYINAKKYNSDIAMCAFFYDFDGVIVPKKFNYNEVYSNHNEVRCILKRIYDNEYEGIAGPTNKIYKRSMVVDNDVIFDESMIRGEDFWFNFGCLKVANTLSYIDECLYYYYQNESSIMHDPSNNSYEHWVSNRKRLLKENEKLCFEIDYNKFYKDFIYKVILFYRDKVKLNQTEIVNEIFDDEYFLSTLKYDLQTPIHIRLISLLIKFKFKKIAIALLKIW